MKGTEKQVAWAEDIRKDYEDSIEVRRQKGKEMKKYYELKYDSRLGGDYVVFYDENMKKLDAIVYKEDESGQIIGRETELPLISDGMVQIAQRGSAADIMHKGKVIPGTDFVEIGEYVDLADSQIRNIAKNVEGK